MGAEADFRKFSELYPSSVGEDVCAKWLDVMEKLVIAIFPKTDCGGKCRSGDANLPAGALDKKSPGASEPRTGLPEGAGRCRRPQEHPDPILC